MKNVNIRWKLVAYDLFLFLLISISLLVAYRPLLYIENHAIAIQILLSALCVFGTRFIGNVYQQIWRYGGIQCYIRLLLVDAVAFLVNMLLAEILPIRQIPKLQLLAILSTNLLFTLAIRMMYRYAFKCGNSQTFWGRLLIWTLRTFAGVELQREREGNQSKIKIAIIGAGRVGVSLAEDLRNNASAAYLPLCFVDISKTKANRQIAGLPVLPEDETTVEHLKEYEIQEVVFALPNLEDADKKRLYAYYSGAGYKIKVYDYPTMQMPGNKRQMREFDVEELLFRQPNLLQDEKTSAYYKGKVILITGGGGSIGSELCRQLAKMEPKQIIILDICENGAYDVQQELRIFHGGNLDLRIEILSICNKAGMHRVFEAYHPQIVINAAAHKHVPLMEHNCIEAVENNVFGTANLIELCEEYHVERFMMVSTDKAVNPTNVMGATKRMCEMLVQCASTWGNTSYSATRFGNVLGSAGSVIPLFKKQIANGGPITLTDKRIIRYFMTIPEASQLVLQSGAMAQNGELFVLDMGQPVRILDLATNMIQLSGSKDIEIIETGLRPGEKLYEELLVKTEELNQTENSLIFIERDKPLSKEIMTEKLARLADACKTGSDEAVRETLKQVVPTFRSPEEVNADAENAVEMKLQRHLASV